MSEQEKTAIDLITSAAGGLSGPVKKSLIKAFSSLLGGLIDIPSAKFRQIAQSIDDTTAAKSRLTDAVAKVVADGATKDPIIIEAAMDVFLPTNIRKVKNRISVAQYAVNNLDQEKLVSTDNDDNTIDEDWINSFARFAEDASSERLRDFFGRVLAGEVVRPGSFGLSTLRKISELDQAIANDFSLAWAKSVGGAVDYSPEWKRGDYFAIWKRLSEAGLMAPSEVSQFTPPYKPVVEGKAIWIPMNVDGKAVLAYFHEESKSTQWTHIDFTRAGREIGSLLDKPDYGKNLREAAKRLPRNGLSRIDLLQGETVELIWKVE